MKGCLNQAIGWVSKDKCFEAISILVGRGRLGAKDEKKGLNPKTGIGVNMRGECRNRSVRPGMNRPFRAWVFYLHETQPVGLGYY